MALVVQIVKGINEALGTSYLRVFNQMVSNRLDDWRVGVRPHTLTSQNAARPKGTVSSGAAPNHYRHKSAKDSIPDQILSDHFANNFPAKDSGH